MNSKELAKAGTGPDSTASNGHLPALIVAAGAFSIFRGLALMLSTATNLFFPVVIVFSLVVLVGSGVVYCWLGVRVAQGNRADLTVVVAVSAIGFVPYLLLGFLEAERHSALGPFDPLLHGLQVAALAAQAVLLAWIVCAGVRMLGAANTVNTEIKGNAPHPPSGLVGANLLLAIVGLVVGYFWNGMAFLLGDLLGIRGSMNPTEWGGAWGDNDRLLVYSLAALTAGFILACNLVVGRRWWGATIGILTGLALSSYAFTH